MVFESGRAKGSLKNNFTFYTPMHLLRLRCESAEYPDIPASSRLAKRAPQRLKLRTNFFVNPKQAMTYSQKIYFSIIYQSS